MKYLKKTIFAYRKNYMENINKIRIYVTKN